ncbi:unnamed protein product [Effrenium voratum]|uniref:Uncharacterized protein n=1 Tax=Effrenium voratum TaxID=2562239 RepID=A0AA36IGF1_9DINO|nr:unnamed protein product [Effrenium voratum]CAJ1387186.1 unnamed protein product [Effrenium voratum]CAJ1456627.1 unnamed protein product [Effrenium voratum]|mmetsp:Transcript_120087/g.285283  ORF Transcript_120087/g.285283 Transcript_120087/m.285283 type:complete len:100 (+) Transcript_120087:40-339(+)|eukprot:CAMPEP_0181453666 /NCGR_PEP_ID=MMETSP1110-20121109/29842_1 /TAXON_ID=174948 /ORGANISM="Symbiodinium sp., Strain CCMP421" /LENGTH=99 /DNA_ID=CAMNT_0023577991 /DNA_START=40 /DNA_END=339 /DNA_ORIENTATION=+
MARIPSLLILGLWVTEAIVVDLKTDVQTTYPKCAGSPLADSGNDKWRCDHYSGATGVQAEADCESHYETAKDNEVTIQCKASRQGPGTFNCLASEPCTT